MDQSAQGACKRGSDRLIIDVGQHVARFHAGTNRDSGGDPAIDGRAEHALGCPHDTLWHTCIRLSRAAPEYAAQIVASIRFDYGVAVARRFEARAKPDGQRRTEWLRAGVSLQHPSVN